MQLERCSRFTSNEDKLRGIIGGVANPKGPESSNDPSEPGSKKRVQRGGSYIALINIAVATWSVRAAKAR